MTHVEIGTLTNSDCYDTRTRLHPHETAASDEVHGAQLLAIVERIERLEEEIKSLNEDKKEVYAEAKGNGFDVKIVKKIVGIRRADPDQRTEEETLIDLYMAAIAKAQERA